MSSEQTREAQQQELLEECVAYCRDHPDLPGRGFSTEAMVDEVEKTLLSNGLADSFKTAVTTARRLVAIWEHDHEAETIWAKEYQTAHAGQQWATPHWEYGKNPKPVKVRMEGDKEFFEYEPYWDTPDGVVKLYHAFRDADVAFLGQVREWLVYCAAKTTELAATWGSLADHLRNGEPVDTDLEKLPSSVFRFSAEELERIEHDE